MNKKSIISRLITPLLILLLLLSGCSKIQDTAYSSASQSNKIQDTADTFASQTSSISSVASISDIPAYSGKDFIIINGNVPDFSDDELTTEAFESYSELDSLGRCQTAYANICLDIMPTEKRGSIGMIKPSGWHTVKYNDIVDGNYLYNRCHLIGYQLSGENANEKNLITGTRWFNVQGMLPFEDAVANCVKENNIHVLYRVTPVFDGDNLVAKGVHMEAKSVEDNGSLICFNIFVYNIQPGIEIDYATGESSLKSDYEAEIKSAEASLCSSDEISSIVGSDQVSNSSEDTDESSFDEASQYILNTNSHKFHLPTCSSVSKISDKNKKTYYGSRDELIDEGYEPCGACNP